MKLRLHIFTIANDQLGDQNPIHNKTTAKQPKHW